MSLGIIWCSPSVAWGGSTERKAAYSSSEEAGTRDQNDPTIRIHTNKTCMCTSYLSLLSPPTSRPSKYCCSLHITHIMLFVIVQLSQISDLPRNSIHERHGSTGSSTGSSVRSKTKQVNCLQLVHTNCYWKCFSWNELLAFTHAHSCTSSWCWNVDRYGLSSKSNHILQLCENVHTCYNKIVCAVLFSSW